MVDEVCLDVWSSSVSSLDDLHKLQKIQQFLSRGHRGTTSSDSNLSNFLLDTYISRLFVVTLRNLDPTFHFFSTLRNVLLENRNEKNVQFTSSQCSQVDSDGSGSIEFLEFLLLMGRILKDVPTDADLRDVFTGKLNVKACKKFWTSDREMVSLPPDMSHPAPSYGVVKMSRSYEVRSIGCPNILLDRSGWSLRINISNFPYERGFFIQRTLFFS